MQDEYIHLRLGDLLYALLKHRVLLFAAAAAGLAVGAALSVVSYLEGEMSREYVITSSIAITSQAADGSFTTRSSTPNQNDIYLAENMADSVIYLLSSDRTLDAAVQSLKLVGISESDIRSNLRLNQYNETQIIELALYWRSAEEGVQILNAINTVAPGILIDTLKLGGVSVVNHPRARSRVGGRFNLSLWLYTVLLGLGAGVGFVLLKTLLRPTVVSPREIEEVFGLELLGEVPENRGYFSRRHSPTAEDGDPAGASVRDSVLSAAHILSHRLGSGGPQCIYITSAEQGEGKTSIAARLAVQLAGLEHKVLLMDLDVRSPSLGGLFLETLDYPHTLNALYRGDATVQEAVTRLTGCLDLLPSILEPRELPLGDAMMALIRELARNYDYVLIDSAPVGQAPETLSLNQVAQSALFVIRFDHASLRSIRSALDRMEKSGVPILGCIVNRVSGPVRPARPASAKARRPRSAGSHSRGPRPSRAGRGRNGGKDPETG